jgi:hypothetical protein
VSAQHHYVSQFHLRQFLDPDSLTQHDPWLWRGLIANGSVKRRAPKNVGRVRALFDGPAGLADRRATLEKFLAQEVEGPAASALEEFCNAAPSGGSTIPQPLMRYLAWAAARSLPMRELFSDWVRTNSLPRRAHQFVGPPPEGLVAATDLRRPVAMVHPVHGVRTWPPESNFDNLIDAGWTPDYREPANFLESVHIQAYYFQVRFFPRFRWSTLRPPHGEFFVIADRAVGWAADGVVNAPPNSLREPSAYLFAPLSKELVLVGRHTTDAWEVTPARINAIIACWAHEWIAGPNYFVVERALSWRQLALEADAS